MDSEMRCKLAREPFREKIRRVGQLIELSAKLKAQRAFAENSNAAAGIEPTGRRRDGTGSPSGRESGSERVNGGEWDEPT